jgi:hypothetical protein
VKIKSKINLVRCEFCVFLHSQKRHNGSENEAVIKLREWLDLVAQLVEHITFNDGALGSSPSGITEKRLSEMVASFFVLALQAIKRGIYNSFAQKRRWHFPVWVYLHHY